MAFKLDFARMSRDAEARRALPPEERAALEARERFASDARAVARDEAERDAAGIELRVLTLIQHPDVRFEMGGGSTTTLYYAKPGVPVEVVAGSMRGVERAVYRTSEAEMLEDALSSDATPKARSVGSLDSGSKVTVLGSEKPRRWKDSNDRWRTVVEFQASRMMPGVHDRAAMEARHPIAEAAIRHEAAATDREREAIARGHLGQEPARVGIVAQAEGVAADGSAPVGTVAKGGRDGIDTEVDGLAFGDSDAEIDALLKGVADRALGR